MLGAVMRRAPTTASRRWLFASRMDGHGQSPTCIPRNLGLPLPKQSAFRVTRCLESASLASKPTSSASASTRLARGMRRIDEAAAYAFVVGAHGMRLQWVGTIDDWKRCGCDGGPELERFKSRGGCRLRHRCGALGKHQRVWWRDPRERQRVELVGDIKRSNQPRSRRFWWHGVNRWRLGRIAHHRHRPM